MSYENGITILVVDDNPATLYSTSHILESAGYKTLRAATGEQGVELAKQEPHLIILDINLPDMDGYEVCRRIRSMESMFRTPIIHLSATFVQSSHQIRGLEVGADGYLTHPVEPPVLIATVNAFLRARRAEDEMRKSEAKFRAVFDNALSGIALLNKELVYVEVNPAMCGLLGRPKDEIIGHLSSEFMSPERRKDVEEISKLVVKQGFWRGNLPMIRADRQIVFLDWNISIHSVPGVMLAIGTDVSDRLRVEGHRDELLLSERAARTEAERANRIKDEFLAVLSHELRTPLNAIVGWTQILRRKPSDDEDIIQGLDTIERNAKVQTQLISDLLDVSRITSGKLRLEVQSVDAVSIVEGALSTIMPAAEAKGINIEQQLEPTTGNVRGDPSRLQQIVWNLFINAVKFTPRGGKIYIKLARVDSHVELTVRDTGIGISPDLLPYLFERFRQGDTSATRFHGGLGLGLAIVKHLVEMHGGTVTASSEGKNKGSTFVVSLPVPALNEVIRPSEKPFAPITSARGDEETPPWNLNLRGVRVMVIDDDLDARSVLRRILEECEAEVVDAEGVKPAMALLANQKPHVLISDISMPEQDGYDLIRQIRELGHSSTDIPAIALTAFARNDDRDRALRAGYQIHLTKPVDAGELSAAVAALAGRSGR